ncbi:carboxypeptidase-like regulatory domain-containing protein [Fodinibius sediminis]|uniref:CarboxypepD_reg-like domain-containing protein n=1 Tax=Fodinibius sediminis TaxID=1214077 RepID=A0A521DL16_9BACT|nr:carboxypeptidase-like regulatory domain-containing protein [Fodinibius sediminis]SMO71791.1 CarboxypepD_reg-like domain-containing protein [Fodinibius sediminis]
MSTLINNYPVFEDNQVLTSSQLNQLQNYLNQQNRLTRVTLIGIGVVCGMDIVCSSENDELTITKGVGVTSEGHLITIGDCVTTQYRTYDKPNSVSYPPFEDPVTQLQDVELYELLTEEAEVDPEDTVTELSEDFLDDKIVLLFLECYDKDLKSCLGKSCDELGIDRIISLRKLVISKEELEKVKERINGGLLEAAYPAKYDLPVLQVKRALIRPGTPASRYYIGMAGEYLEAIDEVWEPLYEALYQTYEVYEPVLEELYPANPFEDDMLKEIKEEFEAYLASYSDFSEPVFGIQYFYDFVKDLMLAYEEFRLTAFDLSGACCPDRSRFPKHLMLGKACAKSGDLCDDVEFRNEFVASPVFSRQRNLADRVRMLHKRLVLLWESFDLERLEDPWEREIKITPSCEKKSFISDRAIPFYYDASRESGFEELGTLENNWDFDLQRQCRTEEMPLQLSYDNHQPNSDRDNPIATPLKYDLDPYNFLRIEGHISKDVDKAEAALREIKNANNLSFDIKKVYFGDLMEEKPLPDCLVEDLQPQYSIWRNKVLLFLKNLVRSSKTAERAILNRNMITAEPSASRKRSNFAFSGMGDINLNISDFTNIFTGADPSRLDESANRFYSAMRNLERAGSPAYQPRTAAYASYTDTSIRDLFSSLNNCLHQLIDAMPRDLRDFDMEAWLTHYKCALRVVVNIMKWIAGYATTPEMRMVVLLYLYIIAAVHRLLSFVAIYPYITIRILNDTLQERREALVKSLQLSRFRDHHPGADHKAGVAPGQTFLLAYQLPHQMEGVADNGSADERLRNIKELSKFPFGSGDQNLDFEQYLEMAAELEGLVVADFTLPFICCDECEDVPSEAVTLDPFAPPVTAVAKPDNLMDINGYDNVEIQLINDLYDPAVYEADITSSPNFGTPSFREDPYEPDNTKTKQVLVYEVDLQKVAAEIQRTDDFFIIDEFNYEIKDLNRQEVVGNDTVTVFIPVERSTKPQTGIVTGTVEGVDVQGNREPLVGGKVTVEGEAIGATSDLNGAFRLSDVPLGDQTLVASYVGYINDTKDITVGTGTNTVSLVLNQADDIHINYERILKAHEIEDDTEDARKIKKYYAASMTNAKERAADIEKREAKEEITTITKTASAIEMFSDEEDINVVKLNNEYNTRRNELVQAIQNTSGREKELHREALKNLTEAYLNRLAYSQPKELSSTTRDVLKESSTIFNAESDLDMKKTVDEWKQKSKGYISEDFKNNLNDNLKLK